MFITSPVCVVRVQKLLFFFVLSSVSRCILQGYAHPAPRSLKEQIAAAAANHTAATQTRSMNMPYQWLHVFTIDTLNNRQEVVILIRVVLGRG